MNCMNIYLGGVSQLLKRWSPFVSWRKPGGERAKLEDAGMTKDCKSVVVRETSSSIMCLPTFYGHSGAGVIGGTYKIYSL